MTHALFVSLSTEVGIKNPHVFLFGDEDSALRVAIETLTQAGLIVAEVDGSFRDSDGDLLGRDRATALESFQDGLGASEYFHVYEATVVE